MSKHNIDLALEIMKEIEQENGGLTSEENKVKQHLNKKRKEEIKLENAKNIVFAKMSDFDLSQKEIDLENDSNVEIGLFPIIKGDSEKDFIEWCGIFIFKTGFEFDDEIKNLFLELRKKAKNKKIEIDPNKGIKKFLRKNHLFSNKKYQFLNGVLELVPDHQLYLDFLLNRNNRVLKSPNKEKLNSKIAVRLIVEKMLKDYRFSEFNDAERVLESLVDLGDGDPNSYFSEEYVGLFNVLAKLFYSLLILQKVRFEFGIHKRPITWQEVEFIHDLKFEWIHYQTSDTGDDIFPVGLCNDKGEMVKIFDEDFASMIKISPNKEH